MKIECMRRYGQPKLEKPKECSNKNLIGSVRFSFGEKAVQCKVWRCVDTIYVLHRDWFSDCISFEEAERRGMNVKHRKKFIYDDNFGGVILRNEAVISFSLPDISRFILDNRFELVKKFSAMIGVEWFDLHCLHRWEDFFEEILKLIKTNGEDSHDN
jgi:hypothetical protein